MTSSERKELRYRRRKEKRNIKNIERIDKYSNINNAFCFHKVMYYSDKCCNGVRWKKSTSLFQLHQFTNIGNTCFNIKNDKYKVNKTYRFLINERGKTRVIDAPHIKDRLVHKVITNEILIPLYEPHLIYDNGASQMNKGFIFAVYRVKKKLKEFYNKYRYNGYVILIDFSKFFENCSHEVIHNIHKKYVVNDYTIKVIEDYLFIGKGIALGVEIAQREASMIPNILDHLLSNNSFFTCCYMDDTICIIEDIDKAKYLLEKYKYLCNILDIKINTNKTKIIKINNIIKYCKWKYIVLNNKVIIVPFSNTIHRQRRKLKKMLNLYLNNKIDNNELEIVKTSFNAYLNIGNSKKYMHR